MISNLTSRTKASVKLHAGLQVGLVFLALTLGIVMTCRADDQRKHVKGTVPIPKDLSAGVKMPKGPAPNPLLHPLENPDTAYSGDPTKASPGGSAAETSIERARGPAAKADCSQKHPIETFVQIASATSPEAARSGGVYFLSDLRESRQVYFLKSPESWPEQITFFPDGVPYFKVSPDGEKLLVATQHGGDEQFDIYLLEPRRKATTPLLVGPEKRIESVAWAPDSAWFAYTSNERDKTDFDLYRYDLAQKKGTLLSQLTGHNEATDVSPDGKRIAVENYRAITDGDILVWDMAAQALTNLTKHDGTIANRNGQFSGDSKGVFFLSDEAKGIPQLFFVRLSGKKKPLTSGKWEVEDFALDSMRTSLAYLVNEEGYSRFGGFLLDKLGRRDRNLPVPRLAGQVAGQVSFSFGRQSHGFFYAQSSSTESSDIWYFNNPASTRWTRSLPGILSSECLTKEKLVHYPSFDKLEIPAFLYYPADAAGPVPFILYIHGGPESQYRPGFGKSIQYFLERGFGVFAPNVRGSSGYGRDYTLLDNYKKRMDSVQDVIEGARWLLKNGYAKSGQLAIYGGSYGGFMVLRSIEVEPELFAVASESVGITNFVTFLKNTKPYRRALREAEYGPLTDETFLRSISPMTYIDRIKTPLLIFHGANDPRVPVSEAEQIVKELTRRGVPVESKIFSDEGHGNTKLGNIMEQARMMVYFFEKHIQKRP